MRTFIKVLILITFVFTFIAIARRVFNDYNTKKATEERIRVLPDAQFLSLNGDTVNLWDSDHDLPLVIIYFHPECEFCWYEGREIGLNAAAFKYCQMVFITYDDSLARVESFCKENHLFKVDNLMVLHDAWDLFERVFGKSTIPSTFIYGSDRRLKKHFSGETKPEAILNEIRMDAILNESK